MTDALSEIARNERRMRDENWPRCAICGGRYMNDRQLALHVEDHTVKEMVEFVVQFSLDIPHSVAQRIIKEARAAVPVEP